MGKFTYGMAITVVGMGGTLLSLCLVILFVHILKRIFPYREAEEKDRKEVV